MHKMFWVDKGVRNRRKLLVMGCDQPHQFSCSFSLVVLRCDCLLMLFPCSVLTWMSANALTPVGPMPNASTEREDTTVSAPLATRATHTHGAAARWVRCSLCWGLRGGLCSPSGTPFLCPSCPGERDIKCVKRNEEKNAVFNKEKRKESGTCFHSILVLTEIFVSYM